MDSSRPTTSSGCGIQVVVRLRPMNAAEQKHGTLPVVTAKTAEKSVCVVKGKGGKQTKHCYTFDNVFTGFSTQEEVFEATVKPVIGDVMRGFESTVFAYGQTGTGKTHTMEGSLNSPEMYGVIPRSAQAIFECLKQPQYKEKVVTCSYLEIYNEDLRDLLLDDNHDKQKLDIMEGKNGMFCRGLTERVVKDAADVLQLMQKAQHQRVVGETKMNKSSSRSHCLFTIQVHGKYHLLNGEDGDMEFTGKLHMVDLAGSECAKTAGNDRGCPDSKARETERSNINKSLLTLGRTITILKDKSMGRNVNVRVPYRDSKLTRILQESLGGRCKTVIIATLSPSITAIEESMSTLNYAQSANGIINKPISSSLISLSDNQYSSKSQGDEGGTSVESWQEMEMRLQYMQTQVEEAQAALARKHIQHQDLQDRADKAEASLLENKQKLYNAELEIKTLKNTVESETKKRKTTEKELQHTQINLKKTSLILQATQTTESSLTSEAMAIIGTLEKVIGERNELHYLVVGQVKKETDQKAATKGLQDATFSLLNKIESSLADLCKSMEAKKRSGLDEVNLANQAGLQFVSETQKLVDEISTIVSTAANLVKAQSMGENGVAKSVEASAMSICSDVQGANDVFMDNGNALTQTCGALKSNFHDCQKMLHEKAAQIESSTAQTLQHLDSKVLESKDALLSLVTKLKSALSKLTAAKTERTDALNALVEQWREKSLENTQSIMSTTSNGLSSLTTSATHFKEEMHHHETVAKSLQNQKDFVDSHVKAHVNDISQQNTSLLAHREKIAEYNDSQTKLCEQVMKSIMSTVQTAVKSELGKLSHSQRNYLQALDSDGIKLAESNQRIKQSAEEVMSSIQSTNEILSKEASTLFANDVKVGEQMKSTQEVLEMIATTSSNNHQLISDYATKNQSLIQDMKQLDSQNAQIVQTAEGDGNACSKLLVNGVLKPTSAAMKKTIQSSLNVFKHVDEAVLNHANTAVDEVALKQKSVSTEVNSKLQAINAEAHGLKENILSIANSQHAAAVKLNSDVDMSCATLEQTLLPSYTAQLNSSKDTLLSTINGMSKSTVDAIAENTTRNTSVKQTVQDFSINKMQCNNPTQSAPSKKDCKYSADLSSTPAEDIILKGHNFNLPEINDSSDSAEDAGNMEDIDTSQETNDDDNRSVMSSGSYSVSVPSPRNGLKSRDINVSRANTTTGKKPRRHSRPTVITAGLSKKNKLPSGLRTPSESSRKKSRM